MFDLDLLSEFDHIICSKIVSEYLEKLKSNKKVGNSYFVNHSDPQIAKLAVDLVASMEEHEFSSGWEKLNVFLIKN